MTVFIASTILLVFAGFYAVLLKRKLAETVFLAVFTVISVLYCFGLLNFGGCLLYGIYVIVGLFIVSLIFLLVVLIKHKQLFFNIEPLQGICLYLILIVFALFVNYGKYFHNWDEFSHWGMIVKYFYYFDAFGTYGQSGLMAPQYLPATSIFQYFFTRFSGSFIEYSSYIAFNIMYFSMVMPFVKDLFSKKRWRKNLIFLLIFIMLPMAVSYNFYGNLHVDYILGFIFGFSIAYYFIYGFEKSSYGVFMVSAAVCMLVMTKDMGLLLSIGVIFIISLDLFVRKRPDKKELLLLALPIMSIIFVKLSWMNLLVRSNLNAAGYWKTPSLNDIYMLVTKQVDEYQKQTARNWISAVFNQPIEPLPFSISVLCIIFAIVVIICALYYRKKISIAWSALSAGALAIGCILYQVVLLIMYVFSFSEYEAVRLASYARYTSTYFIGMVIFIMTYFLFNYNNENLNNHDIKTVITPIKKGFSGARAKFLSDDAVKYSDVLSVIQIIKKICWMLFAVLLFASVFVLSLGGMTDRVLFARLSHKYSYEPRETSAINKWKPYFDEANPYVIVQGDNGRLLGPIAYELRPDYRLGNAINDYTIGMEKYPQPTIEDDLYTLIVTPEEWEAHIRDKQYKVIYILKSDEKFINIYGHLFVGGVKDDMVYRVADENGHIKMIPVE